MCTLDLQEKVFESLFEQAEIAKFTPIERQNYEESLKNLRDWFSIMETAKNEGIAEGRAEGEAIGMLKGRAEATIANAHKMIEAGFPIEKILETLGLTAEDLQ